MAPGLPNLEIVPFGVAAYDTEKSEIAYFEPSRKDKYVVISSFVRSDS
jgi:3'-phosphoadenosine 5'-phosphosulfate synthase